MPTVKAALRGEITPLYAANSLGVPLSKFIDDAARFCAGKGIDIPDWASSAPAPIVAAPVNKPIIVENGRGYIPGTPAAQWRRVPVDYRAAEKKALAKLQAALDADPEIRALRVEAKKAAEADTIKAQAARRAAEARAAEAARRAAEAAAAKAAAAKAKAERAAAEAAIVRLISAATSWLAEAAELTARRAKGRAMKAKWQAKLDELAQDKAAKAEKRVVDAMLKARVAQVKRDLRAAVAQSSAGLMRVPVGAAMERAGIANGRRA